MNADGQETDANARFGAFAILLVMPLFFSSNIIFGRAAVEEVLPFTLAFLRWSLTATVLMILFPTSLRTHLSALTRSGPLILFMGFLGMWVCGALVYLALKYTTATNGTLIYTSSPVLIILIEFAFKGRNVGWREVLGTAIAFTGVLVIISRAELANIASLHFNAGDLIFVGAAISWAIYSVLLKSDSLSRLPTLPLFCAIAFAGAVTLAPFAAFEAITYRAFPSSTSAWTNIAGIVTIASLLAFSSFQYGVKVLGASVAGIFMYLLPIYGVSLAVIFLGEAFESFHIWGIALVLTGVIMATLPVGRRG